ncbi:MAG: hypothetical protein H6737_04670 [Alphaproteobacteria bacterium]|nr:hypothetical protein [Alphaproteobacteria bacterium]
MRIALLTLSIATLTGCGLFFGKNDRAGDTSFENNDPAFISDCDITCDTDGLSFEMDAYRADTAAVEFWSSGALVESFPLAQLDDRTWVAYPDWPAGYGFEDCGAEADFVCVITADGDEIRESY